MSSPLVPVVLEAFCMRVLIDKEDQSALGTMAYVLRRRLPWQSLHYLKKGMQEASLGFIWPQNTLFINHIFLPLIKQPKKPREQTTQELREKEIFITAVLTSTWVKTIHSFVCWVISNTWRSGGWGENWPNSFCGGLRQKDMGPHTPTMSFCSSCHRFPYF